MKGALLGNGRSEIRVTFGELVRLVADSVPRYARNDRSSLGHRRLRVRAVPAL